MQQNPGVAVGPGAQHPPPQGAGSGGGPRGPVLTMDEMQNRLTTLRSGIAALTSVYDNFAQQMNAVRGNPAAEAQLNQKMKETQAEIAKRKDYMTKLIMVW